MSSLSISHNIDNSKTNVYYFNDHFVSIYYPFRHKKEQ